MKIGSVQPTHYGVSALRKKTNLRSEKNEHVFYDHDVKVQKFDELYSGINEKNNISFIKLDVEAHELFVLEGMKKTLKAIKICHKLICDETRLLGTHVLIKASMSSSALKITSFGWKTSTPPLSHKWGTGTPFSVLV